MGAYELLLVGLGGALGSLLRALVASFLQSFAPWPTLLVNLAGAFLIGAFLKVIENSSSPETFRAFWVVGLCGGFTTFSAFGVDLLDFLKNSQWALGCFYALMSVVGSVLAILLSFRLVSLLYS